MPTASAPATKLDSHLQHRSRRVNSVRTQRIVCVANAEREGLHGPAKHLQLCQMAQHPPPKPGHHSLLGSFNVGRVGNQRRNGGMVRPVSCPRVAGAAGALDITQHGKGGRLCVCPSLLHSVPHFLP